MNNFFAHSAALGQIDFGICMCLCLYWKHSFSMLGAKFKSIDIDIYVCVWLYIYIICMVYVFPCICVYNHILHFAATYIDLKHKRTHIPQKNHMYIRMPIITTHTQACTHIHMHTSMYKHTHQYHCKTLRKTNLRM